MTQEELNQGLLVMDKFYEFMQGLKMDRKIATLAVFNIVISDIYLNLPEEDFDRLIEELKKSLRENTYKLRNQGMEATH